MFIAEFFKPEITLGSILTVLVLLGGWIWFFGRQTEIIKASEERAKTNRALIDINTEAISRLKSTKEDHERRIDAAEVSLATLHTNTAVLTKLTTDNEWIKSTLKAVAEKLNVTTPPP